MTVKVTVEMEINDKIITEILPISRKKWWARTYTEISAVNKFINIIDKKLKNEEYNIEEIKSWDDDEWEWEILAQHK